MNKISLFILSVVMIGCGSQPTWKTLRENRKGATAIQAQDGKLAELHLQTALEDRPFQPEVHLNMGVAARIQGKVEEAEKNYTNARKFAHSADPEIEFLSHYNTGEALQAAKNVEGALAAYQRALKVRPDSLETKTNIEMMMQSGQGQGEGGQQQENQDQAGKDQEPKEGDKPDEKEGDKPKERQVSKKYQPREFKGELSESDVRKILGEIKQQEQKIRADFNRKEAKERPRGKDW